jgi:hypothetical protein
VSGTIAATTSAPASADDLMVKVGRVALATQGVLYLIIGALVLDLARGDRGEEASQRGALEAAARQPFGRWLLIVLLVGLVAHAGWRIALAIRGEPGDDDDGKSVVKRLANLGRAAIYVGLSVAAVQILMRSGESSGGDAEKKSTATVLDWPGGRWIVIAAGLAIIGAGLWNASKVVTAKFLERLDLSRLDDGRRRAVEITGRIGYPARGVAFGLVGWFLVKAGIEHDPDESRGLDQSLQELVDADHGALVLTVLALGLALFGAYRLLDAWYRKPSEITHS